MKKELSYDEMIEMYEAGNKNDLPQSFIQMYELGYGDQLTEDFIKLKLAEFGNDGRSHTVKNPFTGVKFILNATQFTLYCILLQLYAYLNEPSIIPLMSNKKFKEKCDQKVKLLGELKCWFRTNSDFYYDLID